MTQFLTPGGILAETSEELMRLRRERVRDRRLHEGARISERSAGSRADTIIALYPALKLAQ